LSVLTRLLAIIVLLSVAVLLIGPATSIEMARPGIDKVAHFAAFGLVLWALGVLFRSSPRIVLAGVALAMGALSELSQAGVGRDADVWDFAADALGVITALTVWSAWRMFRPRGKRGGESEGAQV
jgi:VanZ family protein